MTLQETIVQQLGVKPVIKIHEKKSVNPLIF